MKNQRDGRAVGRRGHEGYPKGRTGHAQPNSDIATPSAGSNYQFHISPCGITRKTPAETKLGADEAEAVHGRIELVVFSKTGGPLTKRIALTADGHIASDGSACTMARGRAERKGSAVSASWRR